jgi:electron transfer flavoprotein alpha subunit
MKDAEFVIAINKDADAPIFKVADMSIIGDVTRILPAIIERLRVTAGNITGNNSKESDAGEV